MKAFAPAPRRRTATRRGAGGTEPARAPRPPATGPLDLLDLQRSAGNRAVAMLVAVHQGNGNGAHVRLHGETSGTYDGGSSQVLNQRVRRARGCDCPDEEPCLHASGRLRIAYHVDVTIRMPEVPGGLNACQERRVREFLRNVLAPHEREHARRLRTYNGTTTRPFTLTACGRDALDEAVATELQQMHDTEAEKRATDADALSAAIDPFERDIDLDC